MLVYLNIIASVFQSEEFKVSDKQMNGKYNELSLYIYTVNFKIDSRLEICLKPDEQQQQKQILFVK